MDIFIKLLYIHRICSSLRESTK